MSTLIDFSIYVIIASICGTFRCAIQFLTGTGSLRCRCYSRYEYPGTSSGRSKDGTRTCTSYSTCTRYKHK